MSRWEGIHPSAIIHSGAKIGNGATIGPFSTVEDGVVIGDNCEIQEHVVLRGNTSLGNSVVIYPFSVIGASPQHLGYRGEDTTVEIGDRTVVRESVTIHRGTAGGTGRTVIGSDSLLMAYSHVAHDCVVGNHVIMANSVQLAGHSQIGHHATIGGLSGVTQFCRVGTYCYVGGGSLLRKDLPPYMVGKGNEFQVQGINQVGLTRKGFSSDVIKTLRAAYKILYLQNLTVSQAIEKISLELGDSPQLSELIQFIKSSKMGFER